MRDICSTINWLPRHNSNFPKAAIAIVASFSTDFVCVLGTFYSYKPIGMSNSSYDSEVLCMEQKDQTEVSKFLFDSSYERRIVSYFTSSSFSHIIKVDKKRKLKISNAEESDTDTVDVTYENHGNMRESLVSLTDVRQSSFIQQNLL